MVDKKSLFGWPRPTRAETMPEPIRRSVGMAESMAEIGGSVKSTANQRFWTGKGEGAREIESEK